jgi:hypothetical protein
VVARANREMLNVPEERRALADLCHRLAGMHAQRRDWTRAIEETNFFEFN